MTTLITVGNSEGERRCDARCYEATGPRCDCVCGGRNHGAGVKQAIDNTCEMFIGEEASDAYKQLASEKGIDIANAELGAVLQNTLF